MAQVDEHIQVVNDRSMNWTVAPCPTPAWAEMVFPDTLEASAARMTERRFDALHYEGPGTDLEIGLLRSSRWEEGRIGRLGRVFYDTLLDENAASAAHRCRLRDEQRPVVVGGDLPCPGGRAVNSRYRARP